VQSRSINASGTSFVVHPPFSTNVSSSPPVSLRILAILAILPNIENYARGMRKSGLNRHAWSAAHTNCVPTTLYVGVMPGPSAGTSWSRIPRGRVAALVSYASHQSRAKGRLMSGTFLRFLSSYLVMLCVILKMCSLLVSVLGGE